jgi:hypothetical protein
MSLADKKLILLDTNTLLVFLVGFLPNNLIAKFSKTKQYSKFSDLILETVSQYDQIISNSYIFSEISHLSIESKDFPQEYCQYLLELIKNLVETNKLKIVETAIDKIIINPSVYYLGFNDISVIESPEPKFALLTFDEKLKTEAYKNHLKIYVVEL